MDIKTDYSIGDSAYILRDNKVAIVRITGIRVEVDVNKSSTVINPRTNYISISYKTDGNNYLYDQTQLFASKEALLKSL